MTQVKNRFKAGSAVFKCGCCNRATRDTGGDNTDLTLCTQCYELCGYNNQVSDYGTLSASDIEAVKGLIGELNALGITTVQAFGYPELLEPAELTIDEQFTPSVQEDCDALTKRRQADDEAMFAKRRADAN